MINLSKNKKQNTLQISLARFEENNLVEEKICDIKWDKSGTPLVVSKILVNEHYHHYYNKNGKLTAHLKNNKTGEKIVAEAGISKSVSEIIKKLKLLRRV